MRLLLVGCGCVGEVVGKFLEERSRDSNWLESIVFADYDYEKAKEMTEFYKGSKVKAYGEGLDASNKDQLRGIIKKYDCDCLFDASPPFLAETLFDVAHEMNVDFLNMGTWSLPKFDIKESMEAKKVYDPFMTDHNFNAHDKWMKNGKTAIICVGIDPGVVNVFAKFAAQHLFDELHELHVKDGCNISKKNNEDDLAFGFNVWTILDECLNPSVVWDKDTGYTAYPPFSGEELFNFPEGIGYQKIYQIEHEEVVCMPKFLKEYGLRKCTYKIALDDGLIDALKMIDKLGMRSLKEINYKNQMIKPRDVVAAVLPQPDKIDDSYEGKMCVGVHCKGIKDGLKREIFIYQPYEQEEAFERFNSQAVVAQTAIGATIAIELLGRGIWKKPGVYSPEAFDPIPYMKLMNEVNFRHSIVEMNSEYMKNKKSVEINEILQKAAQPAF
ncbi:saccharopine dehydrogenase family protein [Anaeromicrobium sediminis]|uniref:saccharopine dehydrogenase family protein n=1 Tax=Anaeromicrobium sediminis TaxID=1478221 RepID=UPI001FA915C3|nr:saccharopine dehydrogenase C-terminal domain-containing protein [Anaeromicrobium sediminis]